ncbi:helix-turn-helix domain-containing protein [Citrobacter freundii]|uniref:helix-turn-helix domain-containing protein n=1 Tax=Citrobacter freundii TaxID=546 RepID=UPI001EF13FDC|nr:LuxR C-terminal-related transcriptional regulator [Citrobacter freundii]
MNIKNKIEIMTYPSWMATAKKVNNKIIPHFTHLHGLTLVEVQVLQQIAFGVSLSNLSKSCFRSVKTLSSHKRNTFKKIGINTDAELVHYVHWLNEHLVNSSLN